MRKKATTSPLTFVEKLNAGSTPRRTKLILGVICASVLIWVAVLALGAVNAFGL